MTWARLTYGTAILAFIVLGTAIYYDDTRTAVKPEDMVELIEAVAERQLAVASSQPTNTIAWTNIAWQTAGTITNGWSVNGGVTNWSLTRVVEPSGESVQTSTFVSTGQYFRGWVRAFTNVGVIRETISDAYTVDGYDYVFESAEWAGGGLVSLLYRQVQDEFYELRCYADAMLPGWKWGITWFGFDPEYYRPADSEDGGCLHTGKWVDYGGSLVELSVIPSGNPLTLTNIVEGETNISPSVVIEYQARTVTNVANALPLLNAVDQLAYVDAAIGSGYIGVLGTNLIAHYVDVSQSTNGSFDAWFLAHTNATEAPRLTLSRAFDLLGPGVGTNVLDYYGNTNALWLTFPARGTNAAVYGGTPRYVTKEVLRARRDVLGLMTVTQPTPFWWICERSQKSGTANNAPYAGFTNLVVYNESRTEVFGLINAILTGWGWGQGDIVWTFPGTNVVSYVTNLSGGYFSYAPRHSSAFQAPNVFPNASGYGYWDNPDDPAECRVGIHSAYGYGGAEPYWIEIVDWKTSIGVSLPVLPHHASLLDDVSQYVRITSTNPWVNAGATWHIDAGLRSIGGIVSSPVEVSQLAAVTNNWPPFTTAFTNEVQDCDTNSSIIRDTFQYAGLSTNLPGEVATTIQLGPCIIKWNFTRCPPQ